MPQENNNDDTLSHPGRKPEDNQLQGRIGIITATTTTLKLSALIVMTLGAVIGGAIMRANGLDATLIIVGAFVALLFVIWITHKHAPLLIANPPRSDDPPPEGRMLGQRRFPVTQNLLARLKHASPNLSGSLLDKKIHFADNKQASGVLLVLISGMGLDHGDFAQYMQQDHSHRCIAITPLGFELKSDIQASVPISVHAMLCAELINSVCLESRYKRVVLVGFSAGAEIGVGILRSNSLDARVDAFLALDANMSRETCFISGAIAKIEIEKGTHNALEVLAVLSNRSFRDVKSWINVHRYLVRVFSKFSGDRLRILRDFAREICASFHDGSFESFVQSYSAIERTVKSFKFVFSDDRPGTGTAAGEQARTHSQLIDAFKDYISGQPDVKYRPNSIQIQNGAEHFDLIEDIAALQQNLQSLLSELDPPADSDHALAN